MLRALTLALKAPASRNPKGILARLSLMRQRAALSRLDDAALRDIGLTREEAQKEALRPVWDAPDRWKA